MSLGASKVWGGRDGRVGSRHTWGVLGERGYLRAGGSGVVGLVFYLQEEKFTYNPCDQPEKAMAPYSSTPAWKIPWT